MSETVERPSMPQSSNAPEFSVAEIAGAIRQTLETSFGRVRVRGEVTEAKTYGSGHTYFCLKDANAKLRAVIWKSAMPRVGLKPENGVEVVATGKISAYGDRSEYQLIVERLEYAGAGALLARIEALRVRLAEEGVFAAERKRAIPLLPSVVGVITSAQGAVLHDIRTTVARRFPRPLIVWPVPVQGQGAAERIAAAIAGMDRLPAGGVPRPDVLIVARGGGSLEDLMAFNEEIVVRAAEECRIPLISAVGHETDTTLIDFASDRRAPTPTAAAEMAVPARAELRAGLAQSGARLVGAMARAAEARRHRLVAAGVKLPDLPSLVGAARQRLDDRAHRLGLGLPALVRAKRSALVGVERRMVDPSGLIGRARHRLELVGLQHAERLRAAVQRARERGTGVMARVSPAPVASRLREVRGRLEGFAARLEGASYEQVLARGFVLVRDGAGRAVTSAGAVRPGARLALRFGDGEVGVVAERAPAGQGSLGI